MMKFRSVVIVTHVLALVVLQFGMPGEVAAASLRVPADYPTIQAGIDAASTGDTVLLAPGTYSGIGNKNIDFLGKDVTLASEVGPEATIIAPTGTFPRQGVIVQSGESNARLDGITFTGCSASSGGAVFCSGATLTIINCRIFQGVATSGHGGGIYCDASALTLIDTVIANCFVLDGHKGGAIYTRESTLATYGCTLNNNEASFTSQIDLDNSVATLDRTVISYGLAGSILCFAGSSATLTCCDVFGNASNWAGCIASQQYQNGNISLNPRYCNAAALDLRVRSDSPCLEPFNPCHVQIGALSVGCTVSTGVESKLDARSWGLVKSVYR